MTKEERAEKISAIYKKIANKELSFWCICQTIEKIWFELNVNYWPIAEIDKYQWWEVMQIRLQDCGWHKINNKFTIIWHPVLIWDVLDYIENNIKDYFREYSWYQSNYINLLFLWKNKRLPLEEQSDLCIEYIYNLIKE